MEEFKKQLAELTPHSPLGWDSDSLADELYRWVPLLKRLTYVSDGSGVSDQYKFPGRNVRWIRLFSRPTDIEEIAVLMQECIVEAAEGCPTHLDVVVKPITIPIVNDNSSKTFIAIHTPKA